MGDRANLATTCAEWVGCVGSIKSGLGTRLLGIPFLLFFLLQKQEVKDKEEREDKLSKKEECCEHFFDS